MRKKRLKYYQERRTTSHWPTPIYVKPLQPNTYGDASLKIDYSTLTPPDLSTLKDEIQLII